MANQGGSSQLNRRRQGGLHRRNRNSRTVQSALEVDYDAVETSSACIDLTADVSTDDVIDLTRSQGFNIIDSPVVVLTAADDVGPIRRRRGSGRQGSRRNNRTGGSRFASPPHTRGRQEVHVLPSDDSDDDLPPVPFDISQEASVSNSSFMKSPEGVKISCPVCMDDAKQIQRSQKQIMSTTCGHIFCDHCIRTAINTQRACPSCRKKLTMRSIHPLFI